MGQSSGWLMSRNSITDFWFCSVRGLRVCTTMPSVATVEQAVWSLGIFSTSTAHIRH
jgi:hypothetical protein